MNKSRSTQKLKLIAPGDIRPNPENPRLVFRQEEMESLMLSIDRNGIQVPLTVYQDGSGYVLLDGERRWRCARKLNLSTVPAIIQNKPTELENLILMYNIHSLREQWDYYTIASKLQRVGELFRHEHGQNPTELELSELTGLTRGAIRRCQLLIDLPDSFKELILRELDKPKQQQKFTEDFFIEMEKALKTVTRRIPVYAPKLDAIRSTLIAKYKAGTISAVTDFRQLSKIATAVDGLGIAQRTALKALDRVFDPKDKLGIREAYNNAVEFEYGEKKASRYIESLSAFIDNVESENKESDLDNEFRTQLIELYKRLKNFLGVL